MTEDPVAVSVLVVVLVLVLVLLVLAQVLVHTRGTDVSLDSS